MNYIVLYAEDFSSDVWKEYCYIAECSYDAKKIKIEFDPRLAKEVK